MPREMGDKCLERWGGQVPREMGGQVPREMGGQVPREMGNKRRFMMRAVRQKTKGGRWG